MGVAAAMECLQEAGVKQPGAIITGTAYGCLEDTGLFLTKMIEYNEELLTPTAFIQSTHNTIGAQIGLMLQCNNYNNTFVHRGFSFENALLDGMMLLKEKEAENVLLGAIDEITDISHAILNRVGLYKQGPVLNTELFKSKSKGTIAGEGASFFLLANEPSPADYAKLVGLKTFYKPTGIKEVEEHVLSFLDAYSVTRNDIDLVITGKSGDAGFDEIFDQLQQTVFSKINSINYKHLCGEYPTSSAFAMWVAANIIKTGTVPPVFEYRGANKNKIGKILIYNHYQNIHHSLILISAC
jgi:3-oxoacyl-(acyl-carrier-protein) synthase